LEPRENIFSADLGGKSQKNGCVSSQTPVYEPTILIRFKKYLRPGQLGVVKIGPASSVAV
jgi:hypothetical protein